MYVCIRREAIDSMYMYVCIYVCMLCIRMYVHVYNIRMYIHIYNIHIIIHTHTHTHVYVYVCIHICITSDDLVFELGGEANVSDNLPMVPGVK
jgi:hypothetical protein